VTISNPGSFVITATETGGGPNGTSNLFTVSPALPATIIDDSSSTGFSTTGSWTISTTNGFLGNSHYAAASSGTPSATASWNFTVTPGFYQVWVTWPADNNNASNAPFSINGGTAVLLNQQAAPTGMTYDGTAWQPLGLYVATGSTLTVTLTNNANGNVTADAVMIINEPDIPVAQSQNVLVLENTAPSITLAAIDPYNLALTYSIVTPPANGTLTGTPPNVVYTPNQNYTGADSFSFKASNAFTAGIPVPILLSVGSSIIIDDSQAGFVTTGSWTFSTGAGYLGNMHYAAASSGSASATATWNFTVPSNSLYQIAATWPSVSNCAGNAPYSINGGTPIPINQQVTPGSFSANGTPWQVLGSYMAPSASLAVSLNNAANGQVVADAIMVTYIPDIPVAQNQAVSLLENTSMPINLTATDPWNTALTYSIATPPSNGTLSGTPPNVVYTPGTNYTGSDSFTFTASNGVAASAPAAISLTVGTSIIIDDSQPGFATTGSWTASTAGGYLGNIHIAAGNSGAATSTGTWTFNVVAGVHYQVAATWLASANCATNAPYSLNGGNAIRVNQLTVPSGQTYSNMNWQILGTCLSSGNSLTVTLSNNANGFVIADAIMISIVPDIPVAQSQNVSLLQGVSQAITLSATDPLNAALTYSIATPPTHGGLNTPVSNVVTYTPAAGYLGSDSFAFQVSNGTSYSLSPGTVALNINSSLIIDDSSSTGFSTTGAWTSTTAGGYLGNIHYAAATSGSATATAAWTFAVTPGAHYQLAATWYANTNRASNAVYTVHNGSNATNVTVNQQTAPSGVAYSSANWTVLGSYAATSNTLVVTLSNNANGFVIADAVMATVLPDIPVAQNQNVTLLENAVQSIMLGATDPFGAALTYSIVTRPLNGTLSALNSNVVSYTPNANFTGTDSFTFQATNGTNYSANAGAVSLTIGNSCIIDDSSPSGFRTTGTWTAVNVAGGYLGNIHYAAASSGSATATATWTFTVTPGAHYQLAATWFASTNRATNAVYTIHNGSNATNVTANQQAAPSGLSSNGTTWQTLGIYTTTSSSLTVTIANAANGFVIADAIIITVLSPMWPVLRICCQQS
jgi:hypothetical protein